MMVCSKCPEVFLTEEAFDAHRTGRYPVLKTRDPGSRRCLNSAEIAEAGLVKTDKGAWRAWRPGGSP